MIKKLQALRAKKGFTLVELIVVIAIIGVLAAILIPTLSGVIEGSRKRSAESTCQSVQNIAKSFASQYMAIVGKGLKAGDSTETVDMDTGDGKLSLPQYIYLQIPELQKADTKAVNVTLDTTKGGVIGVAYIEGDYIAEWTATGGLSSAVEKSKYEGDNALKSATITAGSAVYVNGSAVAYAAAKGDEKPKE